ncbi:MAG: hypothetical protein AAF226_12055 [Verrucomicrobiota bacterium]
MQLSDIKDVLAFRAFRPEADNPRFGWAQRFASRRSVLLNINKGSVNWVAIGKKGSIDEAGFEVGEFEEVLAKMSPRWNNLTDDGWIGISMNTRFVVTLEHNFSRQKGWESELRTNPKSIIGSKYDRAKRYALHHSSQSNASLMLACDESYIKSIEESLKAAELKPARICSGLFALTCNLLSEISSNKLYAGQNVLAIAWCQRSICVLRSKQSQWAELRCRSGLPDGDDAAVTQLLKPYIDKSSPDTKVVFLGEAPANEFSTLYSNQLGTLELNDITQENQLWTTLTTG